MKPNTFKEIYNLHGSKSVNEIERLSREKLKQYLKEAAQDLEEVIGPYAADKALIISGLVQARAKHIDALLVAQAIQKGTDDIRHELSIQAIQLDNLYDRIESFENSFNRA